MSARRLTVVSAAVAAFAFIDAVSGRVPGEGAVLVGIAAVFALLAVAATSREVA